MTLFKYSVAEQYQSTLDTTNNRVTIISALQPLVLTQDTNPPTNEGAIMVVGSMDLTVYADAVVIRGPLSLPGKAVKIYARTIDTEVDSTGNPGSINVNGIDGAAPAPPSVQPAQAAAGTYTPGNDFLGKPPTIVQPTVGTGGGVGATGNPAGNAGSIDIYVESFMPDCRLSLFAIGGKGGDGQQGQQGGQGGNGYAGHGFQDFDQALNGQDGAAGGNGGNGGNAGQNGNGGTINLFDINQTTAVINCLYHAGPFGNPGAPGPGGAGGNGGQCVGGEGGCTGGNAGANGLNGSPGQPCPTPGQDGALNQKQVPYDDLALFTTPDQRLMVLKTARTFYLSADPSGTGNQSYKETATLLQWLVNVTKYFSAIPAPTPPGFTPDEVAQLSNIYQQAHGLAFQLSQRLDIYGNPPNYVPMGSYSTYQTLLNTLINTDLAATETAYESYFKISSDENTKMVALNSALAQSQNHLASLTSQQSDVLSDATALVQTINTDQTAVDKQKQVLLNKIQTLEDKIIEELHRQQGGECLIKGLNDLLDAAKIVGTISGDKEAQQAVTIAEQVSGLLPPIDSTGFSDADLSKLIQSLQVYGQDVQSMADAYTNSQKLIVSGAPNSYKVLQKQTDFDKMLQPFLSIAHDEAQAAEDAMNLYTSLILQMNNDILKYNSDIAQLAALAGQIAQTQSQITQAQQTAQQGTDPGLPAMVNFMSGLYQSSKALCLHQLYMTYRAYAFWALDENSASEFFAQLGLNTPGDVVQGSLSEAQSTILSDYQKAIERFGTPPERFPPAGSSTPGIQFVIDDPDVIKFLHANNELYFTIPPAYSSTSIGDSPFHGLANVRILTARPWVHGAMVHGPNPGDSILNVNLTHNGSEVIVQPDGTSVSFSHQQVPKVFKYDCNTLAIQEDADFGVDGTTADSPTYALLGPFTQWHLEIKSKDNSNLDLSKVDKITIEFSGTNYAFTPAIT